MKNGHKYVALIIVFIILVISITVTYLYIHYKEQGTGNFIKKYSDIVFNNVSFDYENDLMIKVDNKNDSIHIQIPELNNKKAIEINIDALNIGNNDMISDNYTITNVMSNVDNSYVSISSTLDKDDVIKGGDSKKVVIRVKYNGNIKGEIPYYNFNLNYSFKEQSL